MIDHTYSNILQQYLISTGLYSTPANPPENPPPEAWPLYANNLPTAPPQAAAVYNTTGVLDGRTMPDGKKLIHPGFQIMFRTQTDAKAGLKSQRTEVELDKILRKLVVIDSKTYMIQSVTRTTPLIPIGSAEGGLLLYTINGTMTVKEMI